MKNLINIGIPSKGRLKNDVLKIFQKNKLKLSSERGERDLFGYIKKLPNIKVVYLHAREIIERLGDAVRLPLIKVMDITKREVKKSLISANLINE